MKKPWKVDEQLIDDMENDDLEMLHKEMSPVTDRIIAMVTDFPHRKDMIAEWLRHEARMVVQLPYSIPLAGRSSPQSPQVSPQATDWQASLPSDICKQDHRTVFIAVGAPVEIGLVESLSRPGGNITGVTYEVAIETWGKRIELLKEILPDLDRVAVLKAARDPNSIYAMKSLEPWSPQLKVALWPIEVEAAEGLQQAFAEIARNKVRALLVIGGALTFVNRKRIAELALQYQLPSCGNFKETVELGGLASISPSFSELAAIGARITIRIIEGASPRDIPVQQPSRYETCLNLKTAKALGLTIPPTLLARADQVIE